MKHAAPVRRQLGFSTIFNLLGPLTNPAGAEYQLLGTSSVVRAALLAEAMNCLGGRRALIVCGNDQLDEVCLWGPTTVFDVTGGQIVRNEWCAADFGLPECCVSKLTVSSPTESAAVILSVLHADAATPGQLSPAASMVIANTAAALVACDRSPNLTEGVNSALEAVRSGRARQKLTELVEWTQRHAASENASS